MAMQQEVLSNVVMSMIVAAYMFGGERPWVSKTTAVAVFVTQVFSLISALAVFPYRQASSGLGKAKIQKATPFCAGLSENPMSQCALCMAVIFCVVRALRLYGLSSTMQSALPFLCLGSGALLRLLQCRVLPELDAAAAVATKGNACKCEDCDEPLAVGNSENPSSASFWQELGPILVSWPNFPKDEPVPEPSEILSSVLLRFID